MNLIRYMSFTRGIESLRSGLFKVLRPLDANDPYEMMGACRGNLREEVITQMLSDMRGKWESGKLNGSQYLQYPKWEDVERRVCDHKAYFRKVIMERQTQQCLGRIISFVDASKVNEITDQLMWAHYGEGGSGVRIWFDEARLITGYSQIFPVKYSIQRPCIDLGSLKTYEINEGWTTFLFDVVLTKSMAWKYECEMRMVISSRAGKDIITEKDDREYISIPPKAIIRVDFGPKGKIADTVSVVKELRQSRDFAHVDFRVATFDEFGYQYQYPKYDDLNAREGS